MAKTMAAFYELPPWLEDMQRLQRKWDSIISPLTILQENTSVMKSITEALESPAMRELDMLAKQCTPGMTKMIQQEQELLAKFAPLAELQAQIVSQIPDWTRSVFDAMPYQYDALRIAKDHKLAQWAKLADYIADTTEPDDSTLDAAHKLSEEEQQTIACEITTILSDDKNWDQRFMDSMVKLKSTHPTLAWVFEKVFLAILISVISGLMATAIGQALFPAKVYEEPRTTSQVVYHIEQHQTVVVVGEVPYYYEVEIKDEDTDQTKTGYVSKRSIRIEEDNESVPEVTAQE